MTFVEFGVLLLIAAIAGSLGQGLAGFDLGGCFISIIVGFIGAIIGLWLARSLSLPEFLVISVGGSNFPLIWSVIGAAIFSALLGLISGRRQVRA